MTRPVEKYDLLLTGRILTGHKREAVAAALVKLMRVSEAQALQLLSEREQVVKRGLSPAALVPYIDALRRAGAETRTTATAAAMSPQDATVAGTPARPDLGELSDKDLDAVQGRLKNIPAGEGLVDCPCCRMPTLQQRGAREECVVCGWSDFPGQSEYQPDKAVAGRNFGLSLAEAREEFEAHGSINPAGYTPNEVPLRTRVINILLSLFFVGYSGYCLWTGQMYFPFINKVAPGRSMAITFQGIETWMMSAALLSATMFCVLSVADHYDKRRNEHAYQKGVKASIVLFSVFMMLAMILYTFRVDGFGDALFMAFGMLVILGALAVRFSRGPIEY